MAAGWPTWLVPVLAVGRALTTHHRPHNCPYKSVALGPVPAVAAAQAGPGCGRSAGNYGLWQVLAAVSAVTPAHRAAPGHAGGMAGVTWPA